MSAVAAEPGTAALRRSLFEALAGSEAVGVAVCDREFRYLLWNRFMERLTGLPASAVLGRNALEVYPHLREERLERVLNRVLDGETVSLPDRRYTVPGVRAGWVSAQYWPHRSSNGAVAGVVGIVHDVTERKRAEEENERLAAFPRESPNPVLECDAGGSIVYANPAAARLAADLGMRLERALPARGHADLVRAALASGTAVRAVEVAVDGRVLSWSYHPHPPLGLVHLFAEDVTLRRAMEERLRHEALHDALTGLPNRRCFMDRLSGALQRERRRRGPGFAVLFMDLDRFKLVNDGLGHHVGDQLLVAVAGRLRGCLRDADTVARLGGDEFAVLVDGASCADAALRTAEGIQRELSPAIGLGGYEVFTTASIGIALGTPSPEQPELLLRNADIAMYRAKARGAGRCEVFDRELHALTLARLQLDTDLRRAVERGALGVHYQPIVALDSGRMAAVEALARWNHPVRGWVPPDEFIRCAEESGLIVQVGAHVLAEACRSLAAWGRDLPAAAALGVSVNLSVKQLAQADLVEQVRRTLEGSGMEPGRLRLEVTESVLVDNVDAAAATLRRLKELGARIYMDDFGTGYSSLAALHRLPLDGVKVDRSFVRGLDGDARSRGVLRAVMALARELGLEVVVEGVEEQRQMEALRELGCGFAQGYLFSPAVDGDRLREMMASGGSW